MDRERAWKAVKGAAAERMRGRRTRPLRERPPLSREEFAADARLPDETPSSVIDAIRATLGRFYGVPAEVLHPDDTLAELRALTGKDADAFELLLLSEQELRGTLGEATLPATVSPATVGDLTRILARALAPDA